MKTNVNDNIINLIDKRYKITDYTIYYAYSGSVSVPLCRFVFKV